MRRRRNFQSPRSRNRKASLGWVGTVVVGAATDTTTVSATQLVGVGDFLDSPAGQAFVNVKRIIGDVAVSLNFAALSPTNFTAPLYWAIFIQDLSDVAVPSPDSSTSLQEETTLAHGIIMLQGSFGGVQAPDYFPEVQNLHVDVKSNRRVTSLQECFFAITLGDAGQQGIGSIADAILWNASFRTLITTGIKTA